MTPANGAEALALALERSGVTHVFGMPGTQNAPLFSALARTGIHTVLTGSELTAAFMANGFHRAGGAVPVVAAIPGPGFTYALTGFAEAAQDNAAMILLTGTPEHQPGKRFTLQAIDQAGMVEGLARGIHRLETPAEAAAITAAACHAALDRGPGPVLLEVSPDVLGTPFRHVPERGEAEAQTPATARTAASAVDPGTLAEIAARLASARRVVILAGQGAVEASPALHRLVACRPAMVVTTVSGRGTLPESHPWSLAFDFLAGSVNELNRLFDAADFVLVLGCRTSHNGTGGFALRLPDERSAQVDVDPEVLGANLAPRWTLLGDVGAVLERLLAYLDDSAPTSEWSEDDAADWRDRLRRKRTPNPAEPSFPGVIDGQAATFFQALQAALPTNAIVVTDTGHHQIMTREHLRVEAPRGLIVPSDFQSMGFGIPAAIGAALAAPDRRVVAVVGDGGLMMAGLELATAVKEGIDLTVVVFRDGHLGQIRSQQVRAGIGEAAVKLAGVDLAALASATGARYVLVAGDNGGGDILTDACRATGVTLVDVLLGDSPAMERERQLGTARGTARRALGPRGVSLLRRMLRRR